MLDRYHSPRLRFIALLLAIVFPVRAGAQEPWKPSYFPYVIGGPTDGVMLILRYQMVRNAPYFIGEDDDIINPLSFAGAFSAETGIGTRGTRFLSLLFRGPGLIDGWRFHGLLEARRDGWFGYYGLGPEAEDDPANDVDFYRVRRTRYIARGEVTRRVAGPLRAAVAASLERAQFYEIEAPSLFGPAPDENTDGVLRASLVLDLRDREFVPGKGLLAEAGAFVGSGGIGNGGYSGGYAHVRGYISPREGTVVAGRIAFRGLSDDAPLAARYTMPGWERDIDVLGGPESHRGYAKGRFGGRGALLAGLEVRHDILNFGDFGAVTALGFIDTGRVFDPDGLEIGTDGLETAFGGGLALRILRSAILTLNFAGGGDGFRFLTGIGWSF